MSDARKTLETYFAAFNAGNVDGMLACLTDDVAHHVNEGAVRIGRDKFAAFCQHMNSCYRENLTDIVLFTTDDGMRGAAEFTVNGTYLQTDAGLPSAKGQPYRLPGASMMTLRDGKICRLTTYYNLADWLRQVG